MRRERSSIERFIEAYRILSNEVYIPERYREGYIRLIKKIKGVREDAPTKIKLLQYKIELDDLLDKITKEVYKKIKLD